VWYQEIFSFQTFPKLKKCVQTVLVTGEDEMEFVERGRNRENSKEFVKPEKKIGLLKKHFLRRTLPFEVVPAT
jgi:hypothetical protein